MAGNREWKFQFADAGAVVAHFEQFAAAARELHANVMRTRVETVFEQFFKSGRGAFDDFPCGDLVDQKIG